VRIERRSDFAGQLTNLIIHVTSTLWPGSSPLLKHGRKDNVKLRTEQMHQKGLQTKLTTPMMAVDRVAMTQQPDTPK
jgi:hypothetical protein